MKMATREQFEIKEKVRRAITKLTIRICNDANINYDHEYNFLVEDITNLIFDLVTKVEE